MGTRLREAEYYVIGVLCIAVVRLMATDAVRWRSLEAAAHVAGGTLQRRMRASERETRQFPVIETCT
ncbi:MAG: hypothetical protein JOZ10_07310 [Acidobacteria bacterium]|nr:hypothetical protein [Acidobacteriota bacterium]